MFHKSQISITSTPTSAANLRAISFWKNAFQRVLLPAIETAKMGSALTLVTAERGHRWWAESITCRSNCIRCRKTRATCDHEMLHWWVNTQTHGPGKALNSLLVPWEWWKVNSYCLAPHCVNTATYLHSRAAWPQRQAKLTQSHLSVVVQIQLQQYLREISSDSWVRKQQELMVVTRCEDQAVVLTNILSWHSTENLSIKFSAPANWQAKSKQDLPEKAVFLFVSRGLTQPTSSLYKLTQIPSLQCHSLQLLWLKNNPTNNKTKIKKP